MSKTKLKVNFQKIFSVFLCAVLSFSFLCINVSAFTFDGENRSIKDIYSDWFTSTRDFVSGNSSFEQWRNSNIRFQTDLIGSNLFPGSDSELQSYMSYIEEHLREASENADSTTTRIDDSIIDVFGDVFQCLGVLDFRSQFEQWYQDKYGKEYGKHENSFGQLPDNAPSGYSYYLHYFEANLSYEHEMMINYTGSPIPVYHADDGDLYFNGSGVVCSYRQRIRSKKSDGDWRDWGDWGTEQNSTLGTKKFFLRGEGGGNIVIDTNLPFDFSTADGDDDCVGGGGSGGGELIAPGLTLPEIGDLLTDITEDLENQPDSDNPNKGVEIKITQLINRMHNDLSKVIEYLKKILEKITVFFDNFFDNLADFFQSVFVPSDDYFNNSIMDIKAEFDEAFSFAGDIRLICDTAVTSYKNGSTSAPDISIDVYGVGSHSLDLSFFDKNMPLIRSILCAFIYCSFAFNLYRRIPCYISGGGER